MNRSRSCGWIVAVAIAAACAERPSNAPPAPSPTTNNPAPTVAKAPATVRVLGSMASLVGLVPSHDYLAVWAAKIDGGQPLGDYVDEILASKPFAREVIPALLFGSFGSVRNYYALPSAFVLKRSGDVFYLRAPCAAEEAVAVTPWWDLDSEVRVCPDAYRPKKWTMAAGEHSYRTSTPLACDSQVGSPELETSSLCGCGPNLIRCLRDDNQYQEFNRSLMNEVRGTVAYVIENDLPISTLFTSNATFRDRNVELYYRRQKIGATEINGAAKELAGLGKWLPPRTDYRERTLAETGTWPEEGKWAPREELLPGQHAGVLTAPQILHWLPDRRQRQRGYYEVMWCNLRNSFGATTHKVLELNTGNNLLAHDSWKRLAHTELCTNCHARLDYGFQFFLGYPDSRASTHYHPALQAAGAGALYGHDIADRRGEGLLTPAGFAKLAIEQPEFKSCMTGQIVDYVLGDEAAPDDIRAIEAVIEQTGRFKPAMKIALERYYQRWRTHDVAQPPADTHPAAAHTPVGAIVAVDGALRARLDERCIDCHDETPATDSVDGAPAFALSSPTLPRPLLVRMTEQVAFGMMPKDTVLDRAEREELVTRLIGALWTDPAARSEAARYYLGGARGLPAQQIDNVLRAIDTVAGARAQVEWGVIERGIWTDQATLTPGFLAITALQGIRACTQAGELRGAKLERCLQRAISMDLMSRSPSPHAP